MRTLTTSLFWLTLLTPLTGQSSGGVAPPANEHVWGSSCNLLPWGKTQMRWHQLYERTMLPGSLTSGKTLAGLGWRRCRGTSGAYPSVTIVSEVSVFSTPQTQTTLTKTFATNRTAGTGGIVVRRKNINLPATSANVAPGKAFVLVPFDTPHSFTGPGLLVEVVNYGTTSTSTRWNVDMCSGRSTGIAQVFGSKCGSTNNALRFSSTGGIYVPGSTVTISQTGGPINSPTFHLLGASNSDAGGLPLPFDLGLIGAPGCTLYSSLEFVTHVTSTGTGASSVQVAIPNNPWLSGKSIYTQWINIDPTANNLGATTSAGGQITFGPLSCDGAYMYRLSDNMDTTGSGPFRNRGQVVRLLY